MTQKFDCVVIGAALNGLAMALALGGPTARRPLKVALVDMRDPRDALRRASDGRASAITMASRRMFEALGVWDDLAAHAQPISQIIVTDAKGAASTRPTLLAFDDEQASHNASMLLFENHALLAGLVKGIEASPHITLLTGQKVAAVDAKGPGQGSVTLEDGTSITASLVIAADGNKSPTRAAAGIEMIGWPYDQMGIVCTFGHELPHGGRAEEHFGPQGPFAILPLTGNRCSIVWTCSLAEGRRLLALKPEEFESELQAQVGDHLGKVTLQTPHQGYPLGMWVAKEFTASRLALVGDAAHLVHPLAGLGFNLGLKDVAALAECVADAYALGLDIGSQVVLQRYASWRRFDTMATAAAMDGFNRLFSNSNPVLKLMRDAGLAATQKAQGLKSLFVKEASGMTGTLPKLMRGEPV